MIVRNEECLMLNGNTSTTKTLDWRHTFRNIDGCDGEEFIAPLRTFGCRDDLSWEVPNVAAAANIVIFDVS